jgi:hypothetical protein
MNLKINTIAVVSILPAIMAVMLMIGPIYGALPHLVHGTIAVITPTIIVGLIAWKVSKSAAFGTAWAMATVLPSLAMNLNGIGMRLGSSLNQRINKSYGDWAINLFLNNLAWAMIAVVVIILVIFRKEIEANLQDKKRLILTTVLAAAAIGLLINNHHWILPMLALAPYLTSYRSWGVVLPYVALLLFFGETLFPSGDHGTTKVAIIMFPFALGMAWLINWINKLRKAAELNTGKL